MGSSLLSPERTPLRCRKDQSLITFYYIYEYTVIITPHYGRCWTCRDDYQMKLGDQILATGSTFYGGVENQFVLYYHPDDTPNASFHF
ncbi:hypothetical protein DM860_012465 [Cuscuta australis]|uniref:Uncharacterized protein n=1 Tax=Cuscuta australis TaxID=267555 RepID=A0A328DCS6_9ASTE|nr:hypothetical protein DM860_012465 [Cuscuta australis]